MSIRMFLARSRARWLPPLVAIAVAAAALAAALVTYRWSMHALSAEAMAQRSLQAAIDRAGQAAAPACGAEFAYAQSLPVAISMDKLVQSLQESAKASGVTVLSVSGEPHPPTERSLENLVVSIALHGPYGGIRSSLAESLSRFPTAVLQQMEIKRSGAAQLALEDANVQIAFALRPRGIVLVDCRLPASPGAKGDESR